MKANAEGKGQADTVRCEISHYSLDFMQRGEQCLYVWRHCPSGEGIREAAVLIDMNSICLPDDELEKLIFSLDHPVARIRSLAFAGCHITNQRALKRRLKAYNVELFSNTAFFADRDQAQDWLDTHVTG